MNRQAGMTTVGVALITAVVVGGGAGAFAWMQQQKLEQARGELAEAKGQLATAVASANAARTQLAAVKKELDEQKAAFDLARAERDSAKNLLEAEKQHNERIRAELTLARQQIVMLSQRPTYAAPSVVQPRIMRVEPASSRPQAVGAGMPALQVERLSPPR